MQHITLFVSVACRQALLALFVLTALLAGYAPAQAQRLGGLPDPAFHPKDSALSVPQLNRKNHIFWPGPAGGLFLSMYANARRYDQRGRHCQHYTNYFTATGTSSYYNSAGSFISSAQGYIMPVSPRQYYLAQEGGGGYQQIVDSIRVFPYNTARASYSTANLARPAPFSFYHPFQGFPSYGVVQASPSRVVFFLTHNPTDTAAPHTQTYLRLLDTAGHALAVTNTLTNFRAELAAERNGVIYLLGRQMVDTVPGNTVIRTVNATTLVEGAFANVVDQQLLSASKPKVFTVLPNGKMLVAGQLYSNQFGAYVDMAMRLMPDGSADPTWANTFLSGEQAANWYLDSVGTLRGACVPAAGQAQVVTVRANGGYTSASVAIDAALPSPRALTYQPDLDAWLFETDDINPTLANLYYGWPYAYDSSYGTRHRFYVTYNRQVRPLVNHNGVGMFSDYFNFTSRESLGKIMVSGTFTQIDRKLMPGLAVLHADGTLDTAFHPLHQMDEPLRSQLLQWNYPNARLTPTGRVLLSYSGSGYMGISYLDSAYRLLPNGNVDHGYQTVWAPSTLIPNNRGGYTTIRAYNQGAAVQTMSEQLNTEMRLVELDAEGNFMREYGSYTPDGSYPDTNVITATRRFRYAFSEDDQGGFWANQSWSVQDFSVTPSVYRYRNYYVRYELATGRHRVLTPNFIFTGVPLKIEILAGKRMRLTGCFNLPNGTLAGSYYNIIETDSLCRLDPAVAPIRFYVPDAYGTRGSIAAHTAQIPARWQDTGYAQLQWWL